MVRNILRIITGALAAVGAILTFVVAPRLSVASGAAERMQFIGLFLAVVFGISFALLFVRRAI